jgi:hypothetical protein
VFVRQVDALHPASAQVKPQDVLVDVNGRNARGMKLREVLEVGLIDVWVSRAPASTVTTNPSLFAKKKSV